MTPQELEVVLLCPTGQDAYLLAEALKQDDVRSSVARSSEELLQRKLNDMGAIIIAEEALSGTVVDQLNALLVTQEPWSEIPVILLTGRSERGRDLITKRLESFISSGNVTVLERPFRPLTFLSVVRVALRARRRQYQVRELLISQAEATKVRDDFISIAGHELKTPLTSLKLQAQMALRFLESTRPPFAERMLQQVNSTIKQAGRLNKLVDEMLDITRISKGKLQLQKEIVDLSQLLNEAVENFLPQLQASGNEVVTDISKDVRGKWDAFKLEQVINNLLTNVVRYAPGTKAVVRLHVFGEKAILSVSDEGPGLKPQSLTKIFDRFEKGEVNGMGLGLGLYISKEIIQLHGGSIQAKSEWGKGAEFIIELPL